MAISNLPIKHSLIDINRIDHIDILLHEIMSSENIKRKKEAWKAYNIGEGNQRKYILDELKRLYPETYQKFRVGDIKIAKKILDKISKAYNTSIKRKLINDQESELLSELYSSNDFQSALIEADRCFNRDKYVTLWLSYINPVSVNDNGRYVLRTLLPFEYDLVRDEITGEPLIYILSYAGKAVLQDGDGINQAVAEPTSADNDAQKIVLWSKDSYVEILFRGNIKEKDYSISFLRKENNFLGLLPFVFVSKVSGSDYPIQNYLHEQVIDWNVALSDLKTASATQGHGQLVISYPEGQGIKKAHMGMHTALSLPQSRKEGVPPTTAEYISANPDLQGQLEVLKTDLLLIAEDHGIQAKSVIAGGVDQVKSGFDRLLKEADTQDIIEANQKRYAKSLEEPLFQIFKAYQNYLNETSFKSQDIEVYFERPKVLISDKETLDNIEKREKLGLLLPWEKHQLINPNLTEAQAKEREMLIQEEKQKLLTSFQSAMSGLQSEPQAGDTQTNEVDNKQDNFLPKQNK